ncbi:PilW family protein [Pseudoalteromonas sp. SSDWG2]|uniref:PilW family protein n=1 Tax=Pseudoalteromonas sp. SSDWG2 TaxID=3139391 RepID=UPI003BABE19C
MRFNYISTPNRESGFTLLELMIAMVVGIFLLGGVMFTYLSMKVTTTDTVEMGEMQETGRIALDIIGKDLAMAGFFGRVNNEELAFADVTGLAAVAGDCSAGAGTNSASFPTPGAATNFRTLYGEVVGSTASEFTSCLSGAKAGSDVLQIKRASGQDVSGQATDANQYYVESTLGTAKFIAGGGTAIDIDGTNVWPYNHHVYYVSEDTYTKGDKTITVPVLMRKRLTVGNMVTEPILEGVENLKFSYGMDINGDGAVDLYKDASQMTAVDWEQSGITKIETIQVAVLVRATEEDKNSKVSNRTYKLGDSQRVITGNDSHRRMVFVSTFKLNNAGNNQWSIAL